MKIIKCCKEIIVVYLLQLLLMFISSFIYMYVFNGSSLNSFFSNEFYFIIVFFNILVLLYLLKHYYTKEKEIRLSSFISSIFIVVSVSLVLNMLFFMFNLQNVSNMSISIYLLIFSSGIIGPIVEEYLFRKILLTRLLELYSTKLAIIIECLIFSLFHSGLNGIIYAFIIGLILSIIYVKYKNINVSIIAHMISNTLVLFLIGFNIYILLLSIVMLILGLVIRKKMLA